MNKQIISVDGAPKAVGPYSQGVAVSEAKQIFYFSGMLGINPETAKIEGDVLQQTQQILKNISVLLSENGMSAENVIKTLVFLTDMNNFAVVNQEYAKFFNSNPPARSCVEVSKLPLGGLVEIEVIAAK